MRKINREILALAIPSIMTNITTPLLALMDVVIVGHLGSAVYIAAIAIGGTIFNMIYWLFGFLRMGSSGMTAQANGAADKTGCDTVLYRGGLIALIVSMLIVCLQYPIIRISTAIMDVTGETAYMAKEYFSILIWGAPAVLLTYVISGWLLGMKDAKTPMWISFIINISNIVVSLVLVIVFKMQIKGVACGTLTAQWIGMIVGVSFITVRYAPVLPDIKRLFKTDELRRFFSVNIDIFLRTLCLIAVTVWFTRVGASQGTIILAVNTLLMQFFILFSYFMDGFAYAGESLAGYYIGARDKHNLRLCINALFRWGAATAIIFTVIYMLGGTWIMGLLSSEITVIESSKEYFYWVIAIPCVGFAAFTWDGIYIGATHTRSMLISMAIATAIYFIIYNICYETMGNHGLWIAFLAYLLSRGGILTLLRKRIYYNL